MVQGQHETFILIKIWDKSISEANLEEISFAPPTKPVF